ncbi:MAG TPA: hypothetical protein DDW98_09090 [Gammaproteobacteria bacterium]|nr:hypothetical protein [Gammaproteobacteria bacterium]
MSKRDRREVRKFERYLKNVAKLGKEAAMVKHARYLGLPQNTELTRDDARRAEDSRGVPG